MRRRTLVNAVLALAFMGAGNGCTGPDEETGGEPEVTLSELNLQVASSPDPGDWQLVGSPVRAQIAGGPWTLGQGPATQTDPAKDYPNPNPGVNNMAPYFWPFAVGDHRTMLGYFDYRPRNMEEAIVAARSDDGGLNWRFAQKALTFNPNSIPDPLHGSELGQGHPVVLQVRGQKLLYTVDRTTGHWDVMGLLIHRLTPMGPELPLAGAPETEAPATATFRTEGLVNPDSIISRVPGFPFPVVLYLQRVLGATALQDVTTVRLAASRDGIHWSDFGPVSGLQDDGTQFIGARGTVLRCRHGKFVLFFSGGIAADNASDGFHYIGYAESRDLFHWTVVRGLANPLLSITPTDASGTPESWWMGRVFGVNVTTSANGREATMMFAGYHTASPTKDLSDYRQVGRVSLGYVSHRAMMGMDDDDAWDSADEQP